MTTRSAAVKNIHLMMVFLNIATNQLECCMTTIYVCEPES